MYIKECDLEYVKNKFHDTNKPYDNFNRYICNTKIYDPNTGLDPELMHDGIVENDKYYLNRSHPIRKARALEFVLTNTRIACDRRDRFPAICQLDRPLHSIFDKAWRTELFKEILPEVGEKRAHFEKSGIVTIWPDFDHSVPVWDKLFSLGFPGVLDDVIKKRNLYFEKNEYSKGAYDFYEGVEISYRALIKFVSRLAELAENTEGSERLALALRRLETSAPKHLYDVLLLIYIYFFVCEHIDELQVRSLCNLDRQLYPFYKADVESGVPEQELKSDIAYFLYQFAAVDNYWGQPAYLGGTASNGDSEINPLSYVILDVYDSLGIMNPKLQIKLAENTPKDFVMKALDMIRRGHNSIVFVSEEKIKRGLMRIGVTEEDARLADVNGCYEFSPQGSYSLGMNYVNLLKPLEYAMRSGKDGVTGKSVALATPNEFTDFEDFYSAYISQLKFVIDETVSIVNTFEDYLDFVNPLNLLAGTFDSALERAKDPCRGGALYNGSVMMFGFLANVADSLTMIKKLVFDEKLLTLAEFNEILDNNYKGHEALRSRILLDPDHYGNNKDLPDSIAVRLAQDASDLIEGRPNAKERGGKWYCGFHVARMSYMQASVTQASADGRLRGEELSKNISASMGRSREGATAAILSATKINTFGFVSDASLDLAIHPSAVKGDDGLIAMYALLETFRKRGGHALHINVFDAQTLRAAQREPEKYKDLQIRVCGWNVLFNNINKEEQDGFIRQAEALV